MSFCLRHTTGLVLTLAIVATSSIAFAEPEATSSAMTTAEKRKTAGEHYDRALRLIEDGDFRLSLLELRRAYELEPNWQVLYNIAVVHFRLGNFASARLTFERYLHDGGDAVPPARREKVLEDLNALRIRTAHLNLAGLPPGAKVSIDKEHIDVSEVSRVLVDAGDHRVTVERAGYKPFEKILTLTGGDDLTFTIPPMDREAPRETRDGATRSSGLSTSTVAWLATAGLGVITAGVGTFTYLEANSASNALDSAKRRATTRAELETLQQNSNAADTRFAVATGVSLGVTLLAVGASVYFTLRDGKEHPHTAASGPGNVLLRF